MKFNLSFLLTIFLLVCGGAVCAQSNHNIVGTVVDEQGRFIKSATVIISGMQLLTITEDDGRFQFISLNKGAFHLSVTMLGYQQYNESLILNDSTINLRIVLKPKSIILKEVVIGSGDKWAEYYQIFLGEFLGKSKNAEGCQILNPKVLSFDYNKKTGLLTAHADRFIIIENKRLGYRIRYLLKEFSFSIFNYRTLYDGDTNFEELEGSVSAKKMWARNRLNTYQGSKLHYLRSVFANKVLKNGFITYRILGDIPSVLDDEPTISVDTRPLNYDTLTTRIDSSFVEFNAPDFYLIYNPKQAAALINKSPGATHDIGLNNESSLIKLSLKKAIIDKSGNPTNYKAFLFRGKLAKQRIADLLPLEYQPAEEK